MENLCNIFNIYMATTQAHKSSAGNGIPRKEPCEKIPVNNKFLHATTTRTRENENRKSYSEKRGIINRGKLLPQGCSNPNTHTHTHTHTQRHKQIHIYKYGYVLGGILQKYCNNKKKFKQKQVINYLHPNET